MKTSPPARSGYKGAALVELCLVIIILILLMAGVVDVGRVFLQYFPVMRCGYEGARYASTIRDLPDGCYGPDCTTPPSTFIAQHQLIHDRIKNLLVRRGIAANNVQVTTQTSIIQMPNDEGITKEINITVRVPFTSYFFLVSPFHITSKISAPYLYPDEPTSTQAVSPI